MQSTLRDAEQTKRQSLGNLNHDIGFAHSSASNDWTVSRLKPTRYATELRELFVFPEGPAGGDTPA
jgi:hypothetical protein